MRGVRDQASGGAPRRTRWGDLLSTQPYMDVSPLGDVPDSDPDPDPMSALHSRMRAKTALSL